MTDHPRDPSPADDEDELVEVMIAYQAGRLDAFERLYLALADDLRRYFVVITRDATVAQDLVQDTFMEMHRARRTYSPPRPVRPWIFGIARNVHRRHRRAVNRRARHEQHGHEHAEPHAAAAASSRAAAPHEIDDAVARLPASRREPWLLHHVHGFSFEEIAHHLRIGVGAAKLRSSRAMRALRTMLGAERGGRDE
jgi:RNA polymerase sigma-70 factor, ECF subfamily